MGSYKYYNYIDLGIVSSKKPPTTHLWWEVSTSLLFMVDSTDQTVLLKSVDKGDNWSIVATRSQDIVAGWHDRTNDKIWLVDCDQPGDAYSVWHISTDGNDTETSIDTDSGADSMGCWVADIFIINGDVLVWSFQEISANGWLVVDKVNASPFVEQDTLDATTANIYDWYKGTVYNGVYRTCQNRSGFNGIRTMYYTHSTTTISWGYTYTGYQQPIDLSMKGIARSSGGNHLFIGRHYLTPTKIVLLRWTLSTPIVLGEYNVALMLDRNNDSSADIPNNIEKGYHISEGKIYQLPTIYAEQLNLISTFPFSDTIIGITDHFVIDDSGNMYEYEDQMSYILDIILYHYRNDYPYVKLKYDGTHITISPQQFIQFIGPYTVDGSTTATQIVFEGIAKRPTEGVIQYVTIINQGSEMDERKPNGSKSGDSDAILIDINNDGAPDGPEYIKDGTLASGSAMGTIEFTKSKTLRKVYNDFAEHENFLWSLRPQGAFDYNAGGIDSGADIRYDGSTYFDPILQIKAWKVAKINQIIVNGAIDIGNGILYTGQWDDEVDQQTNGINSITIEDAQLNSDALCQTKANTMGAGETERIRARFKFRKTTYGFIQPGQTITFKYIVANYMTIAEAQFILDKFIMNIKTEVGYAEISSGL